MLQSILHVPVKSVISPQMGEQVDCFLKP